MGSKPVPLEEEIIMALRRISAIDNKKSHKCLHCGAYLGDELEDNTIVTCDKCGQKHFVDLREETISLTVFEMPDLRKRRKKSLAEEQKLLIDKQKKVIREQQDIIDKQKNGIRVREDLIKAKEAAVLDKEKRERIQKNPREITFRTDTWEKQHKEWMEQIQELPLRERKREYSMMDSELLMRVLIYTGKKVEALIKEREEL